MNADTVSSLKLWLVWDKVRPRFLSVITFCKNYFMASLLQYAGNYLTHNNGIKSVCVCVVCVCVY